MATAKIFNLRGAISLIVTWAFLISVITGIVLFVVPQGRVAYWVSWTLGGMSKEQWGVIHIVFGLLFVVIGVWHLIYNWKPFVNYLKTKRRANDAGGKSGGVSRELLTASGFSVVLVVTAIADLPPTSWLMALNDWSKQAWITDPAFEPPFGHAEDVSLNGFCRKMTIDPVVARTALEQAGWTLPDNAGQTKLKDLALLNQSNAMALYAVIKPLEKSSAPQQAAPVASLSTDEIEARFAGSGIGQKSVAEVAQMLGVSPDYALQGLRAIGVETDTTGQLKPLAEQADKTPMDLLLAMAKGGGAQ
ncbi:DUF4405 domain-containing protein [Magnetofaba australis]|uniref:Flavinylation-associated cytochrome domain-containing protein n=1 Tax=Magnetofaba australis IT-1 TaxID=1434232 RepID=A0A1Y2K6W3_9PROT|nr:DUF4405 domain-containing protein [Magnetofaba australis]OSM05088.1 hypothetical protein MAIT1_03229 [Magnetofaba australis IT-1]